MIRGNRRLPVVVVITARCLPSTSCSICSTAASSCSTARWARWSRGSGSPTRRCGAASGSRITRRSVKGCNDLLALTKPDAIEDIHYAVPARRRRHRRDRHVHRDVDRARRLRPRDARARDQPRRPPQVARRAAERADARRRPAALGRRLDRPDHEDRVAVARRQRSGRALGHVPRSSSPRSASRRAR